MLVRVENPAGRKKAVRSAGGFVVIGVGKTETVDASKWSEVERVRYEAAGLVLSPENGESFAVGVDEGNRASLLVAVIQNLPAGSVTKDGKPEVDAINEMLPTDMDRVTANERDEIWADLQAGSTE